MGNLCDQRKQISKQVDHFTNLQVKQPLLTFDLDFLVPFRGAVAAISTIVDWMSNLVAILNIHSKHRLEPSRQTRLKSDGSHNS